MSAPFDQKMASNSPNWIVVKGIYVPRITNIAPICVVFYAKSKFYANRCIAGLIATLSGQYYGFAIGITSKLISPPSVLPLLKAGSVLYVINNAQVSVAILAFRFKGTLWFGVLLYNQLLNRNKRCPVPV